MRNDRDNLDCVTKITIDFPSQKKIQAASWNTSSPWWRHQMETFSALQIICVGNSPVTGTGEFPTQRPLTRSFDVFFDLGLNDRLSQQSWGWWFETPSRRLWRHSNVNDESWTLEISIWPDCFTVFVQSPCGRRWMWRCLALDRCMGAWRSLPMKALSTLLYHLCRESTSATRPSWFIWWLNDQ